MLFTSSKKPCHSQDIQIFVIFPFPLFPDLNRQMKVEGFLMSWVGSHKLADAISGIIQKPPYTTSQTWSGNASLIK